jgi:hypothetical protein
MSKQLAKAEQPGVRKSVLKICPYDMWVKKEMGI